MTTNNRLLAAAALATAIAIPAEGLRRVAYGDIADPKLLTVCYGSTTNVQIGKTYSLDECKSRLNADMLKAVQIVEKCQPGLPENVLAAFSDAVYNMGPSVACESTAARLLRSGDIQGACRQLPRWVFANVAGVNVKLPGLVKRRNAEMALCLQWSQS